MEKKENTGKYHVTKHPDGGWQVVLGNGSKVIRRTKTQEEALQIAKEFAENKGTTVYLHGRKGTIRGATTFKKEEKKPVPTKKVAKKEAKPEPKKTTAKKETAKKETTKKTKK